MRLLVPVVDILLPIVLRAFNQGFCDRAYRGHTLVLLPAANWALLLQSLNALFHDCHFPMAILLQHAVEALIVLGGEQLLELGW